MIKISITGIAQTIDKIERLKEEINKTMVIALNETATQTRNYAVRQIRKGYILESAYLKTRIIIINARPNSMTAAIMVKRENKPLLVTHFSARMTKSGLSVQVKRGGGRYLWKGGFIATINGKKIPFRKTGWTEPTKGRYKDKIKTKKEKKGTTSRGAIGDKLSRKYLETIIGPTLASILEESKIHADIVKFSRNKLTEVFTRKLKYYTSKHFNK